jgi:hypothetical protein
MREMNSYRAYFLSASDHIRDVSSFQTIDDASACAEAEHMLKRSEYTAIEIYNGWRLVWRTERQQQVA